MLSFKHSCLWRTKNTTYYIVMILSNLKLWRLRIKMLYLIHVLTVSDSCSLRDRTKYQMTIHKLSLVNRVVWVTNFCFSFSGLIAQSSQQLNNSNIVSVSNLYLSSANVIIFHQNFHIMEGAKSDRLYSKCIVFLTNIQL